MPPTTKQLPTLGHFHKVVCDCLGLWNSDNEDVTFLVSATEKERRAALPHAFEAIHFSGADTPETGQAYWRVARDFLKSQVEGKPTTVWCYKQDRYDREVCHVRVGQQDLGLALIEAGYAWYAFQFAAELSEAQRQAYSEGEREPGSDESDCGRSRIQCRPGRVGS